jgi:hypothetical protein
MTKSSITSNELIPKITPWSAVHAIGSNECLRNQGLPQAPKTTSCWRNTKFSHDWLFAGREKRQNAGAELSAVLRMALPLYIEEDLFGKSQPDKAS